MKITNNSDVSLALAVWLLHDEYDYIDKPNYISVTTLMRPLRQIVLPRRIPKEDRTADVTDFLSRGLGHSIHDSIEKAWKTGYQRSLGLLGYPEKVIARVVINPTPEQLAALKDPIPIYIEQRAFKEINGWTVGGKFDIVTEGIVQDFKSTSAYTWLFGGRDDEHQLQGSLYRWLNPEKITEDFIRINYIFTDWQKMQARTNPKYPQKRVEAKDIVLMDITDTEQWVAGRLKLVETYMGKPEKDLPECTPEELWMSDPAYKYYANPANTTGRSTKNFTNLKEANEFMASKGGKGVVLTIPGEPKRCGFCEAFPVCSQKDKYF
uniref:Exonuclease n=1 Tax=Pseudomonas phage Arace01 TaxID=3138526 RepID=A0AAU6W0I7_9VIRU